MLIQIVFVYFFNEQFLFELTQHWIFVIQAKIGSRAFASV